MDYAKHIIYIAIHAFEILMVDEGFLGGFYSRNISILMHATEKRMSDEHGARSSRRVTTQIRCHPARCHEMYALSARPR